MKEYLAGGVAFLDPREYPPPIGCKVLLLSPGGVCVIGNWDRWFLAWHPLPTIPPEIKAIV